MVHGALSVGRRGSSEGPHRACPVLMARARKNVGIGEDQVLGQDHTGDALRVEVPDTPTER